MIRLLSIIATFALLAGPTGAQTYPDPVSPFVNDFADLLDDADEAELVRQLKNLRADHGIEMTVVTILRRSDYGDSDTIEAFATGLFNAWGVGDATRNDGIMVLVARADREMRIELGAGFPRDWDWQARLVVDDYFLPSFRADNYARGIMTGSAQTIERIALPFAEGHTPEGDDDTAVFAIVGSVFAAIAALMFRGRIADVFMRFRRCPNCGARGLRATRKTLKSATRTSTGNGQRDVRCPSCDYRDRSTYTIPRRARTTTGGSFGGGRSSGGGASGRW